MNDYPHGKPPILDEQGNCAICGEYVTTRIDELLGQSTVREIDQASMEFVMDLRTMAFYTDFLFTKESNAFRYSLMREPL